MRKVRGERERREEEGHQSLFGRVSGCLGDVCWDWRAFVSNSEEGGGEVEGQGKGGRDGERGGGEGGRRRLRVIHGQDTC
eukprot:767364-Hanusia_phi.AAC.5